ncbi:MAG: GGDEF domain-containing phosphodiesterase [Gammaproteobacteria bacterium]|nr:GGDEF domain-containing phosphodiesterase [Gammaproteobacteria bacterium]
MTIYPDDNEDIDILIRHADQAMYQAKLAGKHRYQTFDSYHDKQLIQKHHKLDEIQQALNNNEFTLYYQPKVNMVTGKVFGVEALIRWFHPDKGIIPPLAFLPLIDGTDMELQVGDWVIKQALEQMADWLNQDIKLEVSVNIASHHLLSEFFFENLKTALAQYPAVDPQYLQLEILESSALSDLHTIGQIITRCQDTLGVNVALDDFGTGYSSLTHLRNLTANTIKIDQSFIRDMLDDPNDYTIVDGVLGLADAFGRDVIAEGVEATNHGLMLIIMGCKQAQGYGIAKPMPADQFPNWLAHYTPNQQWLACGNKDMTKKQKKIKLFKLISEHWKNTFTLKTQSSPEDNQHWPIMSEQHDPCGQWIKRAYKEGLFDQEDIQHLEYTHKNVHRIAHVIQGKYQEGDIDAAKNELALLQSAFDKMNHTLPE